MQSEEASSLQPTPLPASSGERSDLRTVIAVAMVAYAASSVVHELVGHGSGCLLTGVKPVLVTSILLQSAGGNRIVDVGGPVANILFGAGAFNWFQRQAKFTAFSYFLWLFAALNLGYVLETTRDQVSGVSLDGSILRFNAAMSRRLMPWLYVGGEARYLRAFNEIGPNALAGQAVYLGPVFYAPLAAGITLSGAWDIQAWGQAIAPLGGLDLTNFERNQVKLRLSFDL